MGWGGPQKELRGLKRSWEGRRGSWKRTAFAEDEENDYAYTWWCHGSSSAMGLLPIEDEMT